MIPPHGPYTVDDVGYGKEVVVNVIADRIGFDRRSVERSLGQGLRDRGRQSLRRAGRHQIW
jgi:hypothetical protein